jgi:DNA helicase-2/ATP-dependent DNA helicase PcrA
MADLNPEQQTVVEHETGPMRVASVAGSGKSTALVERTAYLITKKHVSPTDILIVSFSRDARDVMEKRLNKRLPTMGANKCVRTFHSLGLDIFNTHHQGERQTIDTTGVMYLKAITESYRQMSVKPERKAATRFASLVKNDLIIVDEVLRRLGRLDARIAKLAEKVCEDAEVDAAEVIECFFRAEKFRKEIGIEDRGERRTFVTFDDMIYESAMLLKQNDIRKRWVRRWKYVMQDEVQDVCPAQNAIAESLCREHRNYVVVGDSCQSIFGFRGARPESMLAFEKEWPGAKTVFMHRNYRSGIEIVNVANRIMAYMPANTVVTDEMGDVHEMTSERGTHSYTAHHVFSDSRAEAEAVVANIKAHAKDGVSYADQAVLMRMNRMTRDVEIALAIEKVPYRLVSGVSFFTMKEAKILFSHLRIMMDRADEDAFRTAFMLPSVGLGKASATKIVEGRKTNETWPNAVLRLAPELAGRQKSLATQWARDASARAKQTKTTPAGMLRFISESVQMETWLKRNESDAEDSKVLDNLEEVIDIGRRFDTCAELLDTIDQVEAHRAAAVRKRNAVTISTVHRQKGTEYPIVYLIQAADGLFPASRADIAEERRVFYVACTRAMDELWISRPSIGGDKPLTNSPFVIDLLFDKALQTDRWQPGRKTDQVRRGTQMGLSV